jgi:hypothetical protein
LISRTIGFKDVLRFNREDMEKKERVKKVWDSKIDSSMPSGKT